MNSHDNQKPTRELGNKLRKARGKAGLTQELIRKFAQINKGNVDITGGKGASLGEMTHTGIPVPPGFVVLSTAFERFIQETNLKVDIDAILHKVNHQEIHTIEHASEEIHALIMSAEIPRDVISEVVSHFAELNSQYVAVRSSATAEDSSTAAWAGQLESYLNTTRDSLLENVKRCWASLFTPRAIFYRFEKGLRGQHISVAVVVQKMVESEISGIAFSVHPVTQDRNQLIIEACFGLGEAIVSGQITPDSYVVEKQPRRIIDKNIQTQTRELRRAEKEGNKWSDISKEQGEKQVLPDNEILELSEMILRIENHFGFPCDIEWVFEKGKFYIVQSRPVTALSKLKAVEESKNYRELVKEYGREYSLFRTVLLNQVGNYDILNFFNSLSITGGYFVFRGKGLVYGYHDVADLPLIFKKIGDFSQDQETTNMIIDEAGKLFEWLRPYYKLEVKLNSIEELKKFYELYRRWSLVEVIVQILPMVESVPVDVRQRSLKLRKITQMYSGHVDIVFENLFSRIYPNIGSDWKFILPEEVWENKIGLSATRNAIRERKKGFVMHKDQFYAGKEINGFLKELGVSLKYFSSDETQDLKGQIAQKGFAKGRVKVIDSFESISKVGNGDILVATMTSPRYLPAMKKAAAFVTDEGGITCHAAIIAREMRKPCIIGTKVGTEMLKDGDMVEVDANRGIVRLVE